MLDLSVVSYLLVYFFLNHSDGLHMGEKIYLLYILVTVLFFVCTLNAL